LAVSEVKKERLNFEEATREEEEKEKGKC